MQAAIGAKTRSLRRDRHMAADLAVEEFRGRGRQAAPRHAVRKASPMLMFLPDTRKDMRAPSHWAARLEAAARGSKKKPSTIAFGASGASTLRRRPLEKSDPSCRSNMAEIRAPGPAPARLLVKSVRLPGARSQWPIRAAIGVASRQKRVYGPGSGPLDARAALRDLAARPGEPRPARPARAERGREAE